LSYDGFTMKAARLLAITLLLQARGKLTATELGRVLEVSERTIYRDIASLEGARVPVVAESGPEGGYSLAPGYRMDPTQFSGEEAASLAIGGAILQGLHESDLAAALQQALAKIEAALPPEFRDGVRAGRERFLFDAAQWYASEGQPDTHFPVLRAAVLHGRRVRLCYKRRDAAQDEWRDVDPLGLVNKAGIWYLVGYCLSRRALRTFRLARVLAVEALGIPRASYSDFNLAIYWQESRARIEAHTSFPVIVHADPELAVDILARPLTILRSIRLPDGSLEAEIDFEYQAAAVNFALQGGARLEIVAPEAVRAAVIAAAETVAARHRTRRILSAALR
jgi:predicted DNA-binding transcriptional regulator YafY